MRIDIKWTSEKEKQVKHIIEEWIREHNCYSWEHAGQCDQCQCDAIDLVGELADTIVDYACWEDED
jgi:hypothetical protein